MAKNKKAKDLRNKKIHSELFQKGKGEKISTWLIKQNKGGACMRNGAYRQLSVSQEGVTERSWHSLTDSSYERNNTIHNENMPKKTGNEEKLFLMMKKPTMT